MTTILCPSCGNSHELFWIRRSDSIREMVYRCDHEQHLVETTDGPELHSFTGFHHPCAEAVASIDGSCLREEWTAAYRESRNKKNQLQLTMVYGRRAEA